MVDRWRKPHKKGQATFNNIKGKKMWATFLGKILVYASVPTESDKDDTFSEPGNDVIIYWPLYRSEIESYFELKLTDMNYKELLNFRKVLSEALREAAVVVKLRDANAEDRVYAGQVATSRAYRAVSQLFDAEG